MFQDDEEDGDYEEESEGEDEEIDDEGYTQLITVTEIFID